MESGILIHQKKYAKEFLSKFCMENSKPVSSLFVVGEKFFKDDGTPQVNGSIYRSLIGSLLYLCSTKPDIIFSVNYLLRFMQTPTEKHFQVAKRVLRYVKGTVNHGIHYGRVKSVKLIGFSDSDRAGNDEQIKSILGNFFIVGTGVITWSSKKQGPVA